MAKQYQHRYIMLDPFWVSHRPTYPPLSMWMIKHAFWTMVNIWRDSSVQQRFRWVQRIAIRSALFIWIVSTCFIENGDLHCSNIHNHQNKSNDILIKSALTRLFEILVVQSRTRLKTLHVKCGKQANSSLICRWKIKRKSSKFDQTCLQSKFEDIQQIFACQLNKRGENIDRVARRALVAKSWMAIQFQIKRKLLYFVSRIETIRKLDL